ncbi:hypothetical protein CRYUN_Cryun12cG0126900 [Craigia yunnanensis]
MGNYQIEQDLRLAVRESVANWKIVICHHPIRSIGHHGETKELIMQLLPILDPLQFFTSRGGSKAWKGDFHYLDGDETKFYYDVQGFMSVELIRTDAKIIFHYVFGKVLHSLDLSKQLYTAT